MAKLLAETGINVYQHFESTNPPVVQVDLPACVIGPLFQMKYDEPVSVTDMTVFSSVNGVYDVTTKFLDDANLPTNLALTMKVMITAPASLAGVYDITQIDNVLKRIKISSTSVIPTIGASDVQFSIYNPNKSYVGYGMTVGYPGILSFTDTEKNPVVDLASVKVKISDINGDHLIPTAAEKLAVTNATITNNGGTVKANFALGTDLSSITTADSLEVASPAEVAGFYRITSINTVKEKSTIRCMAASTLTGGDYFSIFDETDAEHKIWYKVNDVGSAPAGTSVTMVTLVGTENAAAVATATRAAINANGTLTAKFAVTVASTDLVTIECLLTGNTPDATDGTATTGFTFNEIAVQGDRSLTLVPEAAITVPASTTSVSLKVRSFGVLASTAGVKLTSNIPYKGSIKVSYKAARKDMFDQFIRVQYVSDLVALAGTTTIDDPENTLVFGLYMAILNAGEEVEVLGVAIAADDSASHASAIEFLQLKKEAYIVTPMTQELAYIEMYRNHVLHVSDPLERWEAIAFLNRALPTYATKTANGSTNGPAIADVAIEADGANVYNLVNSAPGSDFYIYGITTTDVLRMVVVKDGVASTIECPVNVAPTIADKTKIQFTTVGATMGDFTFPVDPSTVTVFKYEVISEKFESSSAADKARQVQELTTWLEASASSVVGVGMSSRRIVYVMPDTLEVPTSLGVRVVPGYFLAAAAAGFKSSLPPQTPIAENAMSGINKLFHSSNYFTNLQIRTIESAGCMFFVQPTDSAAPRARRQLTNDVSSIKTMEISTVSVVDLFAKRVRLALSPLVAKNVMNDNLLNTVKMYIESVVADFNEKGYWKGFEITEFKVNPNATDRLYIAGTPDTFDPFNGADFHLYIS